LSEKILQKQDFTNDDNNAENNKSDKSPVAPPMTEMEWEPADNQPICTTTNNEDIATAATTAMKDKGNQLMVRKNLCNTQQKTIASPEPVYHESEYELKRKERIKQNKER
jgi:hypothetical protein